MTLSELRKQATGSLYNPTGGTPEQALARYTLRLIEANEIYEKAIKASIARADDYGDSHCSQPIRQALRVGREVFESGEGI